MGHSILPLPGLLNFVIIVAVTTLEEDLRVVAVVAILSRHASDLLGCGRSCWFCVAGTGEKGRKGLREHGVRRAAALIEGA